MGLIFAMPVIGALLSILLAFFLVRGPSAGISFVLISVCIEAIVVSPGGFSLGINIFSTDLLPVGLFAIGLIRHLMVAGSSSSVVRFAALLVWSGLLFISFARGTVIFGPSAGNDFRPFFYFLAVGVYLSSFVRDRLCFNTLQRYWIRASVVMVALAMFRWVSDATGLRIGPDWSSIVVGGRFRVLTAGQALFIATGLLMLASQVIHEGARKLDKLTLALMGGTVLLLQHRSVWVATFFGLLVIISNVERAHRRRLVIGLAWLVAIGALGAAAMSILQLDSVSGDLRRSLDEISDKRSTIAGRIDGWFALVASWAASGFVDMLIGQPMGSGYERYLEVLGRSVKENPHSYYVQILLRAGLIGLICFIATLVLLAARLLKHPVDTESRQRFCLLGLLAMNALFFLVYQARFEQAMIIAFSIVMVTGVLSKASGRARPQHRSIGVSGAASR